MDNIKIKRRKKRSHETTIQSAKKENPDVQYDFYFLTDSGSFLPLPRALITALGSVQAACYLVRLVELQNYFAGKRKSGKNYKGKGGWFYTTNANMMRSLIIGKHTVLKVKKKLIEMGLIETKLLHGKEYFWINRDKISKLILTTTPGKHYVYEKIKLAKYI